MAKEAKKDPNELTVEQKLKTLFQLQTMLSEIDKIKTLRGELPLEVQDLEDEIAGLSTRIDKIKAEVDELKAAIAGKRVEIEVAKASVEKYKSQQDNVRNNREYDFLTKEIEEATGIETRKTVLGYIQRGGNPSPFDRNLATRLGGYATQLITDRQFGRMVCVKDGEISSIPLAEVAGKLKLVTPEHDLIIQGKRMEISFGV